MREGKGHGKVYRSPAIVNSHAHRVIPYLRLGPRRDTFRTRPTSGESVAPVNLNQKLSAGLLLYRYAGAEHRADALEVFLAHPGGPFWRHRDDGAWTIPKGVVGPGEALLDAACREFQEETGIAPRAPLLALGSIRQKAGKTVHAWAWQGDADPAQIVSNETRTEWPRGSGRWLTYPEIDRCEWFDLAEARAKINPAQAELIDRLVAALHTT